MIPNRATIDENRTQQNLTFQRDPLSHLFNNFQPFPSYATIDENRKQQNLTFQRDPLSHL